MHQARRISCRCSFCTSNTTKQQPNFGIIAALTKDGVIGIDGVLPWKLRMQDAPTNISLDRDRFVALTSNKILILGRRTFADEDPTGEHVKHARVCIVVSKTMTQSDLVVVKRNNEVGPTVMLAQSFDEALDKASNELLPVDDGSTHFDQGEIRKDDALHKIQCWVAGGEMIYKEALQHSNANVIHLTHVDMIVKQKAQQHSAVAHFPMDCLGRYGFQEKCRESMVGITFCLYKKHCR
jgi:dihydrofolate reductase